MESGLPGPPERGSRTVYLVTPVTYDGEKADEEQVAQAFDRLVKDGVAQGVLAERGVVSVRFTTPHSAERGRRSTRDRLGTRPHSPRERPDRGM